MGDAPPGYSIAVEADRIVVRHAGLVTMEEIVTFRRELSKLTTERRLSLILIDLSRAIAVSLTTLDIYELCASHWKVLSPRVAIAVAYRPGQIPTQEVEFAHMTSRNQGVRLAMFSDVELANRWLSSQAFDASGSRG